jgi:hypothetical protein
MKYNYLNAAIYIKIVEVKTRIAQYNKITNRMSQN